MSNDKKLSENPLLADYLLGEMSEADRQNFEASMTEEMRQELQELTALGGLLSKELKNRKSSGMRSEQIEELRDRFQADVSRSRSKKWTWGIGFSLVPLAAAMLVYILVQNNSQVEVEVSKPTINQTLVKKPEKKIVAERAKIKPKKPIKIAKANRRKQRTPRTRKNSFEPNRTARIQKSTNGSGAKIAAGKTAQKATGVNLSKLSMGTGKILSRNGTNNVNTRYKNSAGGAGGGAGSGGRTYGLGESIKSKSVGLAGTNSGVNNFGSGGSGFGSGGLGGVSNRSGAGRGRAAISVPGSAAVVSGGLTSEEILLVVRANLNQIRHCYEKFLQRSPEASGKLVVRFFIDAKGRVSKSSILRGTIKDKIMRACVARRIKRWKFPKPRGGAPVKVTYPFSFKPDKE